MSVRALAWAKKQRAGSTAAKAVLLILADYADGAGVAFPSTRTLSEESEASQTSVRRHLERLQSCGLLTVKPGSGKSPNQYELALDRIDLVSHLDGSQAHPVVSPLDGSLQGGSQAPSEPPESRSEPLSDRSEPPRASDQHKREQNKREQLQNNSAPRAHTREADHPNPSPEPAHAETANQIIGDTVGARPRPIKHALAKLVVEYLADDIDPDDIAAGLKLWDAKGYAASSLPSFVSEAQTRAKTTDTRSVWDKPPDEITDDELDVHAVNEILGHQPQETCPDDIELGPDAERKRWYIETRTAELRRNRIKARTFLAERWARERAS